MEMMRRFWDAAIALDPRAEASDEGRRFPLCRPDALASLFRDAGLVDTQTSALDIPTPFANFDDFWQAFLGGQGPAPGHVAALADTERERLRERLRSGLPLQADGSFTLTARAWAVRGRVL